MSRLPIVIFVILYLLFVNSFVSPVIAQSDPFSDWFAGVLGENKVDEQLQKINDASLPYGIRITPIKGLSPTANPLEPTGNVKAASTVNTDPMINSARQYQVASGIKSPLNSESPSLGVVDVFWKFISDLLSLIPFGNKKAEDLFSTVSPNSETAQQLLSKNSYSTDQLATSSETNGESRVLAASSDQNQAMLDSLPLYQTAFLPLNVGKKLVEQAAVTPFASPIPTQSISITPIRTEPPPDLSPEPTTIADANCSGPEQSYYDYSLGKCEVYTKGPCSWCYLRRFFPDDVSAKKASQICHRESGGNPFSINMGCLKTNPQNRTREYSIGLFQISLWWDDRCPGTIINEVWGNAIGCSVPTLSPPKSGCYPYSQTIWNPVISCEQGPNFGSCTKRFEDRDINIHKAVSLSEKGTKWTDWSTASPANCDIK